MLPDYVGKRIGNYQITGVLGRGGMGVVLRAFHVVKQRELALKLMLGGAYQTEHARQRFIAEAQAMAQLEHPGLVGLFGVGKHEDTIYFAMELVSGAPLSKVIDQLPLLNLANIIAQITDALQYVHENGYIHRDVKPANILLNAEGRAQLMDFGVAKDTSRGQMTLAGTAIGTPAFMAPELAGGEDARIDHRVDIYALGAVLYRGLTGRLPFEGDHPLNVITKVLKGPPPNPSEIVPGVDSELERICLQAMARDPEGRYPMALDLLDDLTAYLSGTKATGSGIRRLSAQTAETAAGVTMPPPDRVKLEAPPGSKNHEPDRSTPSRPKAQLPSGKNRRLTSSGRSAARAASSTRLRTQRGSEPDDEKSEFPLPLVAAIALVVLLLVGGVVILFSGTPPPDVGEVTDEPSSPPDDEAPEPPPSEDDGGDDAGPADRVAGEETEPGDAPSGDAPAGDAPAGDEPSGDEPAGDEPAGDEPAGDEPAGDEPAEDEPAGDEPLGDEPLGDEPAGDEPAGDEPAEDEPPALPTRQDDTKRAKALFVRGVDLFRRGDLTGARKVFDEVIALDGRYAEAYNSRAATLARLGDVAAATADLDRAIQLEPSLKSAWLNRAFLNHRTKNWKGAHDDAERVLKFGDHPEAMALRGLMCARLGHSGAKKNLQRFLHRYPDHPNKTLVNDVRATLRRYDRVPPKRTAGTPFADAPPGKINVRELRVWIQKGLGLQCAWGRRQNKVEGSRHGAADGPPDHVIMLKIRQREYLVAVEGKGDETGIASITLRTTKTTYGPFTRSGVDISGLQSFRLQAKPKQKIVGFKGVGGAGGIVSLGVVPRKR